MSSFVEKYAAEKVANRVFGVKAVANELEVRLPGDCRVTDEDIASAAASTSSGISSYPTTRSGSP